MKRSVSFFLLISFIFLFHVSTSQADWINLTGAENARNIAMIYVEQDHVKIKLEVFIEDMIVFDELIPAEFFPAPIPDSVS